MLAIHLFFLPAIAADLGSMQIYQLEKRQAESNNSKNNKFVSSGFLYTCMPSFAPQMLIPYHSESAGGDIACRISFSCL